MKKNVKIIMLIVASILLVVWITLSAIFKNDFWGITFKDWVSLVLTIIIGIIIAYILNEKSANKKRFIDAYIIKLRSLHLSLESCLDSIFNNYMKKDFTAIILSNNRIICNSIELLANYANKFNMSKEFEFLKNQYTEFKMITTEYTESLKEEEKRNKASLKINLMINKLDEIELKLFEKI